MKASKVASVSSVVRLFLCRQSLIVTDGKHLHQEIYFMREDFLLKIGLIE